MSSEHISNEKIDSTARGLARLKPGYLPLSIFLEVTRLTVTPIVELVPLKKTDSGVDVLLCRRPPDDPTWPNEMHTPGTVLRATDTSVEDGLQRIIDDELEGVATDKPIFVGNLLHKSNRGAEAAWIYWAEVTGNAPIGEFHDAAHLPFDTVESQLSFIRQAVEHYRLHTEDR